MAVPERLTWSRVVPVTEGASALMVTFPLCYVFGLIRFLHNFQTLLQLMSKLSESQLEVIKTNPIKGGLDSFHSTLDSTYPNGSLQSHTDNFVQLLNDLSEHRFQTSAIWLINAAEKHLVLFIWDTIALVNYPSIYHFADRLGGESWTA